MGFRFARAVTDAPAIRIRGRYDIAGHRLFDGVDLELLAGQWKCLLGRSGVGKTTLLRLIAGLDSGEAFEGNIWVSDDNPLDGRISYMAQSDLLLPWLTVLENVVLGIRLRKEKPDMRRAMDLIGQVGLGGYRDEKPNALSGGMRQRTALARTLMEERPIALLDEPFSALDASTRADMQDLAARKLKGKTVLIVTHDPAEAVRLGHQIAVLTSHGLRLWQTPSSAPVRDQHAPEAAIFQAELLSFLRGLR